MHLHTARFPASDEGDNRSMHATYLESVEQAGEVRFHSIQVQSEQSNALNDLVAQFSISVEED